MRFSTIVAASAVTGAAIAKDIPVVVGKGNLSFVPDTIEAQMGDTVSFKFWPKNHSVAQAAFDSPCTPMRDGAWSGFVATTDQNAAAPTTFMMNITNATMPIWLYCSQNEHCKGGMVAVINPPKQGNRTLQAFKQLASRATKEESPTSAAGAGGMLMQGSSMPTAAASALKANGLAVSGVLGMMAYLVL